MKARLIAPLITAFVFYLCALALTGALSQARQSTPTVRLDARRSIGPAQSYRNLTIFPIYEPKASKGPNYQTLDEALRTKTVVVRESGGGGQVNTLYITNYGDHPVYIMAGEVVLGGKQDRVLGRDIIIPPRKSSLPVPVFCVEHGRWTGTHDFASSAPTVVSGGIRGTAQYGAFAANGQAGTASRSAPAETAAMGRAQQEVWDSVARKNAKFRAAPSTGTYRDVLEMKAEGAREGIGPYVKALEGSLKGRDDIVGVVAAVNGHMVAADVFASPALFRKLWPKLLRSFAADAAEDFNTSSRFEPMSASRAKAFLVQAGDAKKRAVNRTEEGTNYRMETDSTLMYQMMPSVTGGYGGSAPVHVNVLRK